MQNDSIKPKYNKESVDESIKNLEKHLEDFTKGQQFHKDVKYALFLLKKYKSENETA